MKYLVIFIMSVGFVGTAFALPPFDSQEIFDFSETIVVGEIISVDTDFSPTANLYHIKAEKFLKNTQDSEIVLAASGKTASQRSGNTVYSVGDRVLFFLTSVNVRDENSQEIFSIHPTSKLVEPEWDKCNVFEKDIPPEHWVFGGIGVLPKISQDEKLDINTFQDRTDFKIGKTVTVSYDVSNISDSPKELELDGILSRSNSTDYEAMSTMSQHVVLEPCIVFKTIEWRFTPGMIGSYLFEINDDSGISYGLGFTVKESVESPLAQSKSGISIDDMQCNDSLVLIQKHDGSPACVKPETKQKLIERGWTEEILCHGCGERSFENYKINCDNQTNPYQEYECFNNAYSNCEIATVNPEIYTIEGDPIYTTLTITPDCKIQGVADMSPGRFWGTSEIIITVCDKISSDEHTWSVINCDANKLSEMQFNFEMQLYPQILECEENNDTWIREKLECVRDKENED